MNERSKILIVDDDPPSLMALEKTLQSLDATIVKAGSGNEALAACLHHDFAVAIMDINMPEMDGYELAEHMRGDERIRLIPIIFVTGTHPDECPVFRGYEAGAVDFIQKPFSPSMLVSKVNVFLELYQQRAQIQESEERYKNILESISDSVFLTDLSGDLVFVCPNVQTIFGHTYEDVLKMGNISLILGDGVLRPEVVHGSEETENEERTIADSCGRPHTLLVNVKRVHIGRARLLFSCRDITERKHLEDVLREAATMNERLLDSLPHPAMLIRKNKTIIAANCIARETGATIGGYCWRDFGKCDYISRADKASYESKGTPSPNTRCTFCQAEESLADGKPINNPAVEAFGRIWDTYWVPLDEDTYLHYSIDITERQKIEQQLRESERTLKDAQAITHLGHWSWDPDADEIVGSDEFYRIFGVSPRALRTYADFAKHLHPDEVERVAGQVRAALDANEPYDVEYRIQCPDGEEKIVHALGKVERGSDKTVIRMMGTVQDVTECHNAYRDQARLTERLHLATRAGGIGVWDWDVKKDVTIWDDSMYSLYGIKREDFSGNYEAWRRMLHPEDQERAEVEVQLALRGEADYETEYRILRLDGAVRHVRSLAAVHRDECGEPTRMLGVNWDVTRRTRLEDNLRRRQEWAQGLQVAGEKVASCTTVEELMQVSAGAPELYLGLKCSWISMAEADGAARPAQFACESECARKVLAAPETIMVPDALNDPPFGAACQKSAKQHGFACCATYPIVAGDTCVAAITVQGEHGGEDGPLMLTRPLMEVFCRQVGDVWHRCLREEQLEAAKQEAEAASRAKSDFLASMSHELRTPLNAIIGFSQVLHEGYFGEIQPRYREYVEDIMGSGHHLLDLINDILDLSKVEAGKMELHVSQVRIGDLLGNCMSLIREKAHKHGIQTELDMGEEVTEIVIEADERKLKQIMFNLLSNAAKFTPDGGHITVSAQQAQNHLLISVTDTGIGIAPEDQERIFAEFYQTKQSTRDKTPGTGLGLALVRRLAGLHGGCVRVDSKGEGKGSCFSFTLPLKQPSPEETSASDRHEGTDVQISDEHPLEDVLSAEVCTAREHNDRFALCRVRLPASGTEAEVARVREVIGHGMRSPDRLLKHIEGHDCLVLMHVDRGGAQKACGRLSEVVRDTLGISITWAIVSFPADGGTPSVLVENLGKEEGSHE